jgi:ATP-dependent protease ClpP protease subunit
MIPIVRNAADAVELVIYGPIGAEYDGITAKQILDELTALPATTSRLRLRVNSLGGSVFEAVTIANLLREQRMAKGRTVEVTIDGIAASAATIITSAGKPIRIADNALMMIHNPFSLTLGDADEHRRMGTALDVIRDQIIATYRWTSPKSAAELSAMMQAVTWMDATEAVAAGFAHEKVAAPAQQAAASVAPQNLLDRIGQTPARFRNQFSAHRPAVAAAPGTLSTAAVYAERNRPRPADEHQAPTATGRPTSFAELAAQVYGGQPAVSRDVIASSTRGGK